MSKLKYYNNGKKEIRLKSTDVVPMGYSVGRLKPYSTTQGKHWYNNGEEEGFFFEKSCPDGYVLGRLPFNESTKNKLKVTRKLHPRSPNKGKKFNQQQRTKLSDSHLGKIYINNGVNTLFISKDSFIPCGYKRGKLLSASSHKKLKDAAIKRWESFDTNTKQSIMKKVTEKGNLTKKKNQTFNTSKPESLYYEFLKTNYPFSKIYKHYKSLEYPYYCDFYVESENKYIELNLHWTHGGRPYDPDDEECQKQLKMWQEKAKTSQFYKNAIQTWTVRDVEKLKHSFQNNLNIEFLYRI